MHDGPSYLLDIFVHIRGIEYPITSTPVVKFSRHPMGTQRRPVTNLGLMEAGARDRPVANHVLAIEHQYVVSCGTIDIVRAAIIATVVPNLVNNQGIAIAVNTDLSNIVVAVNLVSRTSLTVNDTRRCHWIPGRTAAHTHGICRKRTTVWKSTLRMFGFKCGIIRQQFGDIIACIEGLFWLEAVIEIEPLQYAIVRGCCNGRDKGQIDFLLS